MIDNSINLGMQTWRGQLADVPTEHQNGGEREFSDFECDVCWWHPSWSVYFRSCWATGGFKHTFSRFKENGPKMSKYSVSSSCVNENTFEFKGQRKMGRQVGGVRKATVAKITTQYNQGQQNTIDVVEHHGRSTDQSAAAAWCCHVNMDLNIWGMFPTLFSLCYEKWKQFKRH